MEHAEGGSPGPVRAAIDGLSDTARTAHGEIDAVAESVGLAMRHITDAAASGMLWHDGGELESALRTAATGMGDVLAHLDDEVTGAIEAQVSDLEALLRTGDDATAGGHDPRSAPPNELRDEPPDEPLSEPPPLPPLDDIEAPKGTTEWAEEVVQRYPQLTVGEVLAIHHYTTIDGVREMNQHLRNPENTPESDRAAIQARIDAAVSGLKKLPKVEGVTFRGTDIPEHILPGWRAGARASDPAFYSSSADAGVAEGFRRRQDGNAFVTITGATGVNVQQLSHFGAEAEILFLPSTQFRVIDAAWDDEQMCWRFRIVEAT